MKTARIMLVEDERIVALNIKRKLKALGYDVPAYTASGEKALDMMSEAEPDIILMDINIDGAIDGIETASRISKDSKIPVIYLTAYSGDETLERARSTKPYGYLLKPFSDRELHATIQMALERHGFECAIENSERRLRLALEAAEMGVWELDPSAGTLSSEGLNLLTKELTDEVFTGTWEQFVSTVYEPDKILVNKVLDWSAEDDCLCQVEYRSKESDADSPNWYRLIGKAFRQPNSMYHLVGVVQDVTEHKTIERLRRDKEAAEEANRFKSEFLASMSHEVRTPLNGVIGMVDLLQRTELNDVQSSYTKIIQGSGKTLLAVINDILDFSKVEAGKMSLTNKAFDLCDVIEEVVAPFRVGSDDAVALVASIAPETPICLFGDSVRLQQIVGNLLSNAFKFTDRGKVSLRIEPVAMELEKVWLKVTVSDTGVGIAPDSLKELFKPFSQLGNNYRRRQGTGLGLVICQRLVQLMQGEMQVESVLGEGTTFTFTVLLRWKKEPLSKADHSEWENIKILMIDDSQEYRKILFEQAKYLGVDVEVAADSTQAIALAQHFEPDLITIDMDLSEETGFDVERRLKTIPKLSAVRKILLTASCIPPSEEQLADTGFLAAHVKPAGVPQLESLLSSVFSVQDEDAQPTTETEKPIYGGKRVLVAEDDAVNRQVIKAMLKVLGISVEMVVDGEQAWRKVMSGQKRYDLVFMDCQMPVMDGYNATRAIRDLEAANGQSAIPIVALTAHALPEHREQAKAAGMDAHLEKPVRLAALTEILAQYFSSSQN